MLYLYTILLGIIQGITEFLPISSSGHLVILHEFIDLKLSDSLAFDVALHLGSVLAMIIYFWKDIVLILKSFFKNIFRSNSVEKERNMAWYIVIAIIPAAVIGYFFEDVIDLYLRSVYVVIAALVIGAILFLLVEKFAKKEQEIWQINWWKALVVGLLQVAALVPGVSRSGITIITGMSLKLKREAAARFSFLIAIPIILGAGLKKIIDISETGFSDGELWIFITGFLASLVVSYLAVRWLIKFLQSHSLHAFAWYRIVLAAVILTILFLG